MSLTENWLTAYGTRLNGILANNDEMALGAGSPKGSRPPGYLCHGRRCNSSMPKQPSGRRILTATVLQDAVDRAPAVQK